MYSAAGVAILGVASFFIYQALSSSLVYFILPSEYAASPSEYDGQLIRLGGMVAEDSVNYDSGNVTLTFHVTDSIEAYPVSYPASPPELFKENTGVVIEGSFDGDTFMGDNLLIKHSENYQAVEGEEVDLELLKDSLQ